MSCLDVLNKYMETLEINRQMSPFVFFENNCQGTPTPLENEFIAYDEDITFQNVKSMFIPPNMTLRVTPSSQNDIVELFGPQLISHLDSEYILWEHANTKVNWQDSLVFNFHRDTSWIDYLVDIIEKKKELVLFGQKLNYDATSLFKEICEENPEKYNCECYNDIKENKMFEGLTIMDVILWFIMYQMKIKRALGAKNIVCNTFETK